MREICVANDSVTIGTTTGMLVEEKYFWKGRLGENCVLVRKPHWKTVFKLILLTIQALFRGEH